MADARTGKNIVILSDGTGKKGGDGADTNVYKLFRMLENRTPRQVVFYDPGLGTNWARLTGNAFGFGISHNILQCYRFLFDQYEAGDRVFLFGFSRGAFTVRSLAGFLHHFGVLPKARADLIGKAWRIYRLRGAKRRRERADAFTRRHHRMWVRVHFLGVWDTVCALGAPLGVVSRVLDRIPWFQHRFHDVVLSNTVEYAYHALAVDDERKSFHPTLWDEPIPVIPGRPDRHAEQVWFAGAHSDVGGGYEESGLSDIALQWMVRHAVAHGLFVYPKHEVVGAADCLGALHDEREGIGVLWRRGVRRWPLHATRPVVHQSVLDRRARDGRYRPWILRDGSDYTVAPDPSGPAIFGDARG